MNDSRWIREIIDYCRAQGRFGRRRSKDYAGMAVSQIPELFIQYFASLDSGAQGDLARILVSGATGQCRDLVPHMQEIASLLITLCLHGYTLCLESSRAELGRVVANEGNLDRWCQAGEPHMYTRGLAALFEWRHGLVLWGVLYLLDSEKGRIAYDYLFAHAHSSPFRNALVDVKNLYDRFQGGSLGGHGRRGKA
jgi:hypothetical protein